MPAPIFRSGSHGAFSGGLQSFLSAVERRDCQSKTRWPCATFPGDDTWTAQPFAEGVVLIGDAAGYNDPIAAQGLSIALRDARSVRDLILAGARQPSDFAAHGAERSERMQRLRLVADVLSVAKAEDAHNRSARRAYFDELMAAQESPGVPFVTGGLRRPRDHTCGTRASLGPRAPSQRQRSSLRSPNLILSHSVVGVRCRR